jgi:hypothetical protein
MAFTTAFTFTCHLTSPSNAAFDWFVEPNPLGEVTEYQGRKAVRNTQLRGDTTERIQYTVEIPGHGSVWSLELQRSQYNPRVPFTADHADSERRTRSDDEVSGPEEEVRAPAAVAAPAGVLPPCA